MLYRCAVEVFSLIIKVIVQYWAATLMVLILRGALSTARDRSLPAVPIISGDHTHRHALCNIGQKCHTHGPQMGCQWLLLSKLHE